MEVYVKDKELPKSCNDCKFCITHNIKNCRTKKYEEITQCCIDSECYKFEGCINASGEFDEINTCPLKSLDQHDAELKAKWCDGLMNWINTPYTIGCAMCLNREGFLQTDDLKQKLEEMKGEKE